MPFNPWFDTGSNKLYASFKKQVVGSPMSIMSDFSFFPSTSFPFFLSERSVVASKPLC